MEMVDVESSVPVLIVLDAETIVSADVDIISEVSDDVGGESDELSDVVNDELSVDKFVEPSAVCDIVLPVFPDPVELSLLSAEEIDAVLDRISVISEELGVNSVVEAEISDEEFGELSSSVVVADMSDVKVLNSVLSFSGAEVVSSVLIDDSFSDVVGNSVLLKFEVVSPLLVESSVLSTVVRSVSVVDSFVDVCSTLAVPEFISVLDVVISFYIKNNQSINKKIFSQEKVRRRILS
jgi:hypothetical protein